MFVGRRDDRTIYGLWSVRKWDGQEKLADDHADVVAFRNCAIPPVTLTRRKSWPRSASQFPTLNSFSD